MNERPLRLIELMRLIQALVADADLSPSARCVGIALVNFLNRKTGLCCPSYETLAKASGFKRRATINAVNELEAAGWISIARTRGRTNTNTFTFAFDRLAHAPDGPDEE